MNMCLGLKIGTIVRVLGWVSRIHVVCKPEFTILFCIEA